MTDLPLLFSLLESPSHPDFSELYRQQGIEEIRLTSHRRAISKMKNRPPDYLVAEFFYGYSNNYAGVNISNLDVLLYSLQKYAPRVRVIVLVDKRERQYVDQLNKILPLHAVLEHPVSTADLQPCLQPE